MRNKKWQVETDQWGVASGEWQAGSGKWNGTWGVGPVESGKWGMGKRVNE